MGRKTYDSLPNSVRPLPNRRNIVLSSRRDYQPGHGAIRCASLEDGLAEARAQCFIIGGEAVFRAGLSLADRVYLTEIDLDCEGDAFFPVLGAEWTCVESSTRDPSSENDHRIVFNTYVRTRPTGRLYHLPAARSRQQLERMQELEDARICRFCPADFDGESSTPTILSGEHWYVIRNEYPYAGTSGHYLIVSRRHATSFDELPDEAGAELWAIRRKLSSDIGPKATATVERSGDMALNGGSVAHLHVHFLTLDAVPDNPVRFRVSGRKADKVQSPVERSDCEEKSGDR
jgi:dihydrofolate reductase/diadenosine tetraphosphate (Ap4A) HIT family hydrolase